MSIQKEQNFDSGELYIEENGQKLASMTYRETGKNEITIDHTEVAEKSQDKGLGTKMVAAAVDYARENDLKIVPVCPFVKKVIDETPAYQDVLAA